MHPTTHRYRLHSHEGDVNAKSGGMVHADGRPRRSLAADGGVTRRFEAAKASPSPFCAQSDSALSVRHIGYVGDDVRLMLNHDRMIGQRPREWTGKAV